MPRGVYDRTHLKKADPKATEKLQFRLAHLDLIREIEKEAEETGFFKGFLAAAAELARPGVQGNKGRSHVTPLGDELTKLFKKDPKRFEAALKAATDGERVSFLVSVILAAMEMEGSPPPPAPPTPPAKGRRK